MDAKKVVGSPNRLTKTSYEISLYRHVHLPPVSREQRVYRVRQTRSSKLAIRDEVILNQSQSREALQPQNLQLHEGVQSLTVSGQCVCVDRWNRR